MSSNQAGEQIRQIIKMARERAARAEEAYERGAEKVQRLASRSIDLFGGTAVSQVADIAGESKRICDSLYATYQSLVGTVDAQCRPLLEQQPDYQAVGEVSKLITWLNSESEIENNFTASLNDRNLGDMASRRYFATMENQMIQNFWENQYEMCPGRAKAEAEEKSQREGEENRLHEEMGAAYQKAVAAYEKEYDEWERNVEEIERQRKAQLKSELEKAVQAEECRIRKEFDDAANKTKAICQTAQRELEQAEKELAGLGMLAFAAKKTAKQAIERATGQIAAAEAEKRRAERAFEEKMQAMPEWRRGQELQLLEDIEEALPIPDEPEKPQKPRVRYVVPDGCRARGKATGAGYSDDELEDLVCDCMKPEFMYTMSDIQTLHPDLDMPTGKIAAVVRRLCECGRLVRIEEKDAPHPYFGLEL